MSKGETIRRQLFGYFQTLGFYEYRNGWMKGDCPMCGAEEKMGVHIPANRTHCFVCEYSRRPFTMIMEMEGADSYKDLFKFLSQYDSASYKPPTFEKYPELPVVLPEGFKLLKYGDNRIGRIARKYIKNRGFIIKDLSRRGVGYVGRGSTKYFGYIVFPYYRNRRIIYFQTRRFFGDGPKFNNPLQEDFGIGKSQVIYNEGALIRYKEVDLCESVMNALTMGEPGIAINGKAISAVQLSMILKSKVEIVNILLDEDAWTYAIELAGKLVPHKKVRVIKFPEEQDVNDLGKEIVKEMIGMCPVLTNINEVLKLKWRS